MMHSKKKILVIGPIYPYRGGIATFVACLCNLLQKDFEVSVINYSMLYPKLLFPGKTQYDESEKLIFTFPNQRLFSSLNPLSWVRTAKAIREFDPEVIIMDWWNPFFSLCFRGLFTLLHPKYKKRILIVAENVVSHEGRFIDKFLTRMGITIAKSYLVLSDKVAEQIKPYAQDKRVYKSNLPIYNHFDQQTELPSRRQLSDQLDDSHFVMLFFGYIRKYKGLDIALEALALVLPKMPEARLLIVGESYDAWQEYQAIIDQHQMQHAVILVDRYVPNEEVEQYFAVSDVVLLPYRSATQSGILNIAYGFYKPVIANSVGGFSEFVQHEKTGLLVNDINATAFAEAILRFYQEFRELDVKPHISEIMGANSFEKITDYVNKFIEENQQ